MKLIDGDELLSIVRYMTVVDKSVMHRVLVQMQPVDAVPVVRCRDCKHYEWTENRVPEEQTWWCYKHNTEMGNNDYCSYGERKDGDDGSTD